MAKHTEAEMEQMSLQDLARYAGEPDPEETAPIVPAVQVEAERLLKEAENGGPFLVRREIDLGDGSGLEVFEAVGDSEAEAWEAWADKITDAKAHATRKIRELAAELRQVKAVPTTPSPEPVTKTLEEEVAALKAKLATMEQVEQARTVGAEAADLFLASHPDYENDPSKGGQENADRLKFEMDRMKLSYTSENLHKAYATLKQRGLLSLKGEDAGADTPEPEPVKRIAEPAVETAPPRTRKTFSVNTHNRIPAGATALEPSEDDMYRLPVEELRRRANAQLSSR
jgi:hypothetical protein